MTDEFNDRRLARRFHMALPLTVSYLEGENSVELSARTQDVSFRGVYFFTDANLPEGAPVEIVITLPQQITLAGEMRIRCFGKVLRVESDEGATDPRRGVAACIERYEFLPAAA